MASKSRLTQDDPPAPLPTQELLWLSHHLAGPVLDQVDSPVALFLVDGAYDGESTSNLLTDRFRSMIEVTIQPPKTAIPSSSAGQDPTTRDCRIADISARGRMAWQEASGYNQRSRG